MNSIKINDTKINNVVTDGLSNEKNASRQKIKRGIVDARCLSIQNTDGKIEQKKNMVKNQAKKLIRDAWKKDTDSADERVEMEQTRMQKLTEAREYEQKAATIENEKNLLMEEYQIDPQSQEQKDLELLEKYQNNICGIANDTFSDEEKARLKELATGKFTDYQKAALRLNSSQNAMKSEADRSKSEAVLLKENITDAKIDQLKSQDMLKSQEAADELEQALSKDIFGMLVQEAKDNIDKKTEENEEKAEETAKQKEEQEEKIEKAREEKEQKEEIIKAEADAQILKADVSAQGKQVSHIEQAQTHINQLVKKNNLINEDLKGIEIDFDF